MLLSVLLSVRRKEGGEKELLFMSLDEKWGCNCTARTADPRELQPLTSGQTEKGAREENSVACFVCSATCWPAECVASPFIQHLSCLLCIFSECFHVESGFLAGNFPMV